MACSFSLTCAFPPSFLILSLPIFLLLHVPSFVRGDCWLIEGDKGYVWLAICSQNQPPYETIPLHINNTVHDLRLNENKLKAIFFSSLSRFTNLTDLNLTKNELSYIEDGAFAGQANLQVLQLGYNKLTNLTEGMLRGLGRMQCLYLQHNLIEVIATNAFWECPSLSSLDLSSNKLAKLDSSTFTILGGRLIVCELAGNPFHCGCDLYGFLIWLEAFDNVTHTYDRLQCETPKELFGYPLLSPRGNHGRNARSILSSMCKNGVIVSGITALPPDLDYSGMGIDIYDHMGPSYQPTASSTTDPTYSPTIKLQMVSLSSASLLVQIPKPYSKMYILVQYNHTYVSDIMNLKNKNEIVKLNNLNPHTNYTFCVASIRNSQRYNHTCLYFATRAPGPDDLRATPSTTTHYIMTILGCLFGMVIVLGLVYYCLRRRRMQEEKEKSISVKKTILEMRYGLGILHSSANTTSSRLSSLPQVEKMATSFSEAMANKGNYMDVRTSAGGEERVRDGISTIAKEVDKVNQIINNCIDALKLDSVAVVAAAAATATTADNTASPPPPSGFLSPPYRDPPPATASRPLQRQLSADAAVVSINSVKNRCSVSSGGSVKNARVFSLEVPDPRSTEPCKYPEKGSPVRCGEPLERLPLIGVHGVSGGSTAQQHHLEVHPDYHCSEHRHSFPALYYEGATDSPAQKVSFLKPLTRTKKDTAYSQLSPRHHNYSGYSSSPEYSSESTLKIWERFRPYKKSPREEAYIAAGHALRKKVQFAKDEDLHDILDYWKGVSAQQKL
uniref:Extracellular leucine rich repeat and fibronectin type III domain containing 2 n=1 Tax=Sinocyclocheilus grahami TaxID=75366 RepID=A0A672N6Y5_SINGR